MSADDNDLAAAATAALALAAVTKKSCASCGVAEIDDVELKPCPKCDLVKYCSGKCQQEHREKHEATCEERAAELYDELLFKQPESNHLGDCPICFVPMPHDVKSVFIQPCCGNFMCLRCGYVNKMRENNERLKEHRCPFCRHIQPETQEEAEKLLSERAELNYPLLLQQLGAANYLRGDYDKAFRNYTKAAALGDADSMFRLSNMYREGGRGVEKDMAKVKALLEKASIAGHPDARYDLGCFEERNGRIDRAVLHWIISANLGEELSIKSLKECYKRGYVSKDDFAAALRAYQAAVEEMKSPQREAARKYCGGIGW